MEDDVLDMLDALGYSGPLIEEAALLKAVETGPSSLEFTELCVWLTSQIKMLCHLEESINATTSADDVESFLLEINGFLKEMSCPYSALLTGDFKERLKKKEDCLKLLLYLSSELQTARILHCKSPTVSKAEDNEEVRREIKSICTTLGLPCPVSGAADAQLFQTVEEKVKNVTSKIPKNHVGEPLLKLTLTPDHWENLLAINAALTSEYECRRRMLIKRLDVTFQSFGWSDKAKANTDNMAKVYQPKRHTLPLKSTVSLAHLLAAREDLSKIIKTSSGSLREGTSCAINKVLMGRVPDRGGRPSEIEAPPPEMPPWMKRQDGGRGGRGGGGGGGRGGGGWGGGQGGGGGRGGGGRGGGGWGGAGGQGSGGGWGGGGGHGSGGGYGGRGGGGYGGRGGYGDMGGFGGRGGYRRY
ncbi:protein FAM98B [Heptranchias perlo]|uniref:protein FAM98B n=1 Tax=Heptranchias perlo TaxID=212740 RepID=UPI0035595C4B